MMQSSIYKEFDLDQSICGFEKRLGLRHGIILCVGKSYLPSQKRRGIGSANVFRTPV